MLQYKASPNHIRKCYKECYKPMRLEETKTKEVIIAFMTYLNSSYSKYRQIKCKINETIANADIESMTMQYYDVYKHIAQATLKFQPHQ